MLSLPYINVPKDVLIPHPGNNYTITLTSKSFSLKTKDISIKYTQDIDLFYKKSFIVVLTDENETPLTKVAVLCTLLSDVIVEDKHVCHFLSNTKVLVKGYSGNELIFELHPKVKFNKDHTSMLDSLLNFMKNNKDLTHIYNEVNMLTDDNDLLLNQTIDYLYPTIEQDYEFFNSKTAIKKINIINLLIITYNADFKKSNQFNYPSHVNDKLSKENIRLSQIPQSSIEYSNTLDYIDIVSSLPWESNSYVKVDIESISKTLSESHYGLNNIKETILDHFAFEQLTGMTVGTYLLFDGPPGTGKTSIAKTIAKALNRDFIPIALGGVSDEAEIRGHRRTYIGSKPGRLISALQNLSSNNPLILLDEIDKISSGGKGDPHSALLEILDPEQNLSFMDRYLEIPYDLSNALFICTSNSLTSIPEPLKDRLSILTFTNYSPEEKYTILTKYIIPNFLEKYNLETYNITFKDSFLHEISIHNNLRQLKRIIIRLLKHSARKILLGSQTIILDKDLYSTLIKKEKKKRIGF